MFKGCCMRKNETEKTLEELKRTIDQEIERLIPRKCAKKLGR